MADKYSYFALGNAALSLRQSVSTLYGERKGQQGVWLVVLGSEGARRDGDTWAWATLCIPGFQQEETAVES